MKKHIRHHVASLFLLLPAAVALVATPISVFGQAAAPEVRSLEVRSDGRIEPGARLTFRLVGTPRAVATVRLSGLRERIELREVSPGLYVGRYTVQLGDRIDRRSEIRAVVRDDNRSGSAEYTLAEVYSGGVAAVAPQVAPPPPALRIERFSLAPIGRIEPGAELRFALDGSPGASLRVDLPGIERDVPMSETRPGHYEGSYTLRRTDALDLSRPIVAALRIGDRLVTANLALRSAQPSADNRSMAPVNIPLQIVNHPNEGEVFGRTTHVEGRTAPFASVAIRVDGIESVPGNQNLYSQTLQADANGNFSFDFSPRAFIPGTRYEVVMVATKANARTEATFTLKQR